MNEKQKTRFLQVGNITGVAGTITVNLLANAIPIGGNTTEYLSDRIPNLFVPLGAIFPVIWSVIYVFIAIFAVYQLGYHKGEDREKAPYLKEVGLTTIFASAANISWIFLWHYVQVYASLIPMIVLFLSLLWGYLRLGIGKKKGKSRKRSGKRPDNPCVIR